ncbi:peptidylprolyl isomerase [Rhodohalobacter sp. 8-1]|uniref:peptidylprolyl isomerase n=1 Tax=Rhodohalobacter sp. 8-1 TaxID=3131972 RepID=UPI0030EC9AB6
MTSRLSFLLLVGSIFVIISCGDEPLVYTNDVFLHEFPEVADAIVERDSDALLRFSNHKESEVRSLSWRALAKSEVENPDSLIDTIIRRNEHATWLAISNHTLSEDGLQRVREIFSEKPTDFQYACEVFKRQGAEAELDLILSLLPELQGNYLCSAAAGRILTREEYPDNMINQVITAAFDAEQSIVRRNLLYGFYRNPLNRPAQGDDLWKKLRGNWLTLGLGTEPATDQYMIGILGTEGADLFLNEMLTLKSIRDQQLIIEFIRAMDMTAIESEPYQAVISDLLSHYNPTVVTEMLERLKTKEPLSDPLLEYIYSHHVQRTRNPVIFVTAAELVLANGKDINPIHRKLAFIEDQNPYLTNRILGIYRQTDSEEAFLTRFEDYLEEGGIRGLLAVQALTTYWIELEDESQTGQVRLMVQEAAEAGNRSVVSGLATLLTDEALVRDDDFDWLLTRYEESVTADNRVNIIAFGEALETRFPDRFEEFKEPADPAFRMPDWSRLHAMGTRPYWHLQTEKGEIVIRLDPLSAPFTVSSVDSLTRAGDYDNVAFHRVVHNFVIQGGDVGRGDGFGGPGYRIPTEPSLKSFERGAVGIASSGMDTEGSQYFVMHQWAPHLDANYTLFGEVVRGMDVVDRIQVGDLVTNASIIIN